MPGLVDEGLLLLCELPPQEEYGILFQGRDLFYDGMGEFGPADLGVAHRFVRPHGEGRVQQQDPLFGPVGEVAMAGDGHAGVVMQLLENIDEGGRRGDAILNGEAQPMRLSGP